MRRTLPLVLVAALAACGEAAAPPALPFLSGTETNPLIATTVLSLNNAIEQVQVGAPATRRQIALGTSSQITAVGYAIRGRTIAIPLGNAAAVAVGDLDAGSITRTYTWPAGNATGVAFLDATTLITTNPARNLVGRIRLSTAGGPINDTIRVAAYPTDVVVANGRLFVISSNLDANFSPAGPGVVTEIEPTVFTTLRTWNVGRNPQYGAVANNRLYVTNAGDFGANNGSLSVIDLGTNTVAAPVTGFGDFPGPITIDGQGRAFVSGFGFGTVVWNTLTGTFIRGATNPVCAPVGTTCRGATGAQLGGDGRLYQSFFGSASAGQTGKIFIYDGSTFALRDSITQSVGSSAVDVRSFR